MAIERRWSYHGASETESIVADTPIETVQKLLVGSTNPEVVS